MLLCCYALIFISDFQELQICVKIKALKGESMYGFIVVSVDKKTLNKVTKVDSDCIKYTPVISETQDCVEKDFIKEFPERQFIISMPIEELKKQINFIEKLIC